ncbi:MAG: queuosine precursor transporter [Patescibacteria group bacterium]|nr:queuosine precursor transporter [Patescibacteria group bacterium]
MYKINKLDLIVSIYIFCIAVSELMGAKTFPLFKLGTFQLNASVAIFVIPLLFAINDIITEVYGKARARSIIYSGMFIIFLIFLFSIFATFLPPSTRFQMSNNAYVEIFQKSARISAASLISFTVADLLDVYIFSKIRQKLGKKRLWFRTNASNFISQFVDTSFFITLAFYSLGLPFANNFHFLLGLIIPYWLLKCFMSIIETPFVYMGVGWLKVGKSENVL